MTESAPINIDKLSDTVLLPAKEGTEPENAVDVDGAECAICCELTTNETKLIPCCHVFCLEHISKWMERSTTCPLCRARVSVTVVSTKTYENVEAEKIRKAIDLTQLPAVFDTPPPSRRSERSRQPTVRLTAESMFRGFPSASEARRDRDLYLRQMARYPSPEAVAEAYRRAYFDDRTRHMLPRPDPDVFARAREDADASFGEDSSSEEDADESDEYVEEDDFEEDMAEYEAGLLGHGPREDDDDDGDSDSDVVVVDSDPDGAPSGPASPETLYNRLHNRQYQSLGQMRDSVVRNVRHSGPHPPSFNQLDSLMDTTLMLIDAAMNRAGQSRPSSSAPAQPRTDPPPAPHRHGGVRRRIPFERDEFVESARRPYVVRTSESSPSGRVTQVLSRPRPIDVHAHNRRVVGRRTNRQATQPPAAAQAEPSATAVVRRSARLHARREPDVVL